MHVMEVAAGPVAVLGALIAGCSAWFARRQAAEAKKAAVATQRMAENDAQRRHDELRPKWRQPWCEAAADAGSLKLVLVLEQGRLDHLVIEIYDSPNIAFDVSRQANVTGEYLELHRMMIPGDRVVLWVKVRSGHRRKLCVRATSSLDGRAWEPVLLPELDVVIEGA